MGAYENAMAEEGTVEDFRREIKRIVDEIDDRAVLKTCFSTLNYARRRFENLSEDVCKRSWSEKEIEALILKVAAKSKWVF